MVVQLIARMEENMQFVRVPGEHRAATSFHEETSQGKERPFVLIKFVSSVNRWYRLSWLEL